MQGIPAEWLVELDPATNEYRAVNAEQPNAAGGEAKREREDGRKDDLRQAIRVVPLTRAGSPGFSPTRFEHSVFFPVGAPSLPERGGVGHRGSVPVAPASRRCVDYLGGSS